MICALASYLDARSSGGRWLVRIEDIDPPREEPGAADAILRSLEHHGLNWDGDVLWQHDRLEAYRDIAEGLLASDKAFRCDCPRRQLQQLGGPYPGTCRDRALEADHPHAVRIHVDPESPISFVDDLQGEQSENLAETCGDFIIYRRDKLPAYQLAVAVDDLFQGITHVMRGADLMPSTPRQVHVMQTLGGVPPVYAHHPVLTDVYGKKLSKQTHAPTIDDTRPVANLRYALGFLGQKAPPESIARPAAVLEWAIAHWESTNIPQGSSVYLPLPGSQLQ